ncbi:efflux RND transporter permease subunit [Inmirania thermothiophila]|uniref:HAE1 family hydrophobic/amphiphilic exporter-1 n=1 Tax=Inmirania thermothiophila TaxID=1750597 RepID=A0A3N1Y0N4_9GAMM|nr:efflux RND transporter permease subunit [Inmirania thermothiophila]ROR32399.1 HAE1 family hydrophobic/amphiphilic exporter-1 [Inmirania thermothiophila]
MTLPEIAIRRHVLAWMLSGVLVLFGLVSFQRLGVDRFPSVEFPMISVTTVMTGASPEVVDSSLTSVVEEAVNTVPGIEHIISSSSPGVSLVLVRFNLFKDIDVAFNEVQAKINQIVADLPDEAEVPVVAKVEVGAAPVMWIVLQGDRTLQQLNQYARNVVKKRLETVDGVGEVRIGGERERTIRVELDPARMAALGVTVPEVVAALRREHVRLPGGFVEGAGREALLKLDLEFHDVAALGGLLVAYRDGAPVHLRDLARIEDGLADARQIARFDGEPAVGLGVVKVSGANTVAIVEEVRRRLREEIVPALPPGLRLSIASDDSAFVLEMVAALEEHLALGTLLAALVVWLFLKSLRATLIIAVAIPVSLLGAVAVMYGFGFSINVLTLLALLLLVGIVVDDAIVVLENIHRRRETVDPDPVRAAEHGTREVVFAVLASTLALVSIFAPVIFLGGIIGRFFRSFAVVVTFGVLVSWFVSMTLTPMLCSRYLQVRREHGRIYRLLESGFRAMEAGYRRLLGLVLRWRWTVLGLAAAALAASGLLFGQVGKTFVPEDDEGRFLVVFRTPLGSSIDYTAGRLAEIEAALRAEPGIDHFFAAIGGGDGGQVNRGSVFVRLAPRAERTRHQSEIVEAVRRRLAAIPGVEAFAGQVPILSSGRGEPLQFMLKGPDLQRVAALARHMHERLSALPGMGRLDLDLQLDLPQVVPVVDRERAAQLGIPAQDLATALFVLAGGLDVAKYNDVPGDGRRYDIRLKAAGGAIRGPADLGRVYLRGGAGELVRLDTVARFERTLGPAVIPRIDLQYGAAFYGTPEMPLGAAVAAVREAAAELLPAGYGIQFLGQAEEFGNTARYMTFAFTMALILLYMVLASQFDSFLQPVVIMLAQPLAIIGGIAGLWLAGQTLNIFSMIGMVLLLGLVAKNSILLVDLTNQLRARGHGIDEALAEACPLRMRPVLMTSLTVILAMLPAALGRGAGADTNQPMAVAIIGGMVTSTLLTLVVVPAAYSLLNHGLARLCAWRARPAAGAA